MNKAQISAKCEQKEEKALVIIEMFIISKKYKAKRKKSMTRYLDIYIF